MSTRQTLCSSSSVHDFEPPDFVHNVSVLRKEGCTQRHSADQLRVCSHCRQKGPKSDFFAHM